MALKQLPPEAAARLLQELVGFVSAGLRNTMLGTHTHTHTHTMDTRESRQKQSSHVEQLLHKIDEQEVEYQLIGTRINSERTGL